MINSYNLTTPSINPQDSDAINNLKEAITKDDNLRIINLLPLIGLAKSYSVNYLKHLKQQNKMSDKKFSIEQAKQIGEQLGIRWDKFNAEQFRTGMDVELEHGKVNPLTNVTDDDSLITGKIALAHLNEFPDYYTRLLKMEQEAEKFWEEKNDN